MRLSLSKSKNATSLYVIESTYLNKKHSTRIVEKLGTLEELTSTLNDEDPIEWAKKYIAELNRKEKEGKRDILVKHSPSKIIDKDERRSFNGGYLFLQKLYHSLGINKICSDISDKYSFKFNLDSITSRLLYGRIIYPGSKLSTYEDSKKFIEQPNFELQHIYRGLSYLAKESDFIQSSLYKNSLEVSKRNTDVLYYDCTNFFFEIEEADEDGFRQYGVSKEHRPNPIVQMGLFMDGDGIPLAFDINRGNTNEQVTLKPLEQKILDDFNLSKFVVCTDAGLASKKNRLFNTEGERAFITTQSIKTLKKHLKEWSLDPDGWSLPNSKETYNLNEIDERFEKLSDKDKKRAKSSTFYKSRWINENGLEQRLIVTYSLKYRDYQRAIRNAQIERAQRLIDNGTNKIGRPKQNDFKRFIEKTNVTFDGEVASKEVYSINEDVIAKESIYDGFYGVCTNLEDDIQGIIKTNSRRWEIEECFRIMKSEFAARPVYLSRDDRIKAHFITCFIALIVYRLLEKKLGEEYTCSEIIKTLKDMNFLEVRGEGYIPTYTRTDLTDALHKAFGFRTDYQIVTEKNMKKILKDTKK